MLKDQKARREYDKQYKRNKRSEAALGTLVQSHVKVSLESASVGQTDADEDADLLKAEFDISDLLVAKKRLGRRMLNMAWAALEKIDKLSLTQAMDFLSGGLRLVEGALVVEEDEDDSPEFDLPGFLADPAAIEASLALLAYVGKPKSRAVGPAATGDGCPGPSPGEGCPPPDAGPLRGTLQSGDVVPVPAPDHNRKSPRPRRSRKDQAAGGVDAAPARKKRVN